MLRSLLKLITIFFLFPQGLTSAAGVCEGNCENGFGRLSLKNGSDYEGNFQNKKFHGKGTLKAFKKDRVYGYSGDWSEGKRHGRGTQIFSSGGRYIGEWLNDEMAGKGIFTSILGSCDLFEAMFHKDGNSVPPRHEGFAVDYCTYDGIWQHNLPDGDGMLLLKFDIVRVIRKDFYDFIKKNERLLSYLGSLQKYDRLPALIEVKGKWGKGLPKGGKMVVKDGKGSIFLQETVTEADSIQR